ncbi:MAG: SDR family oxidoreductase [Gammaproteobacteria bacterium]|nr:MAG: SDR family oxidoreductase [Gammaproteobacteria bacterium]
MDNAFQDTVAVVTGGSRGMGADVARALREQGCRVAVLSRTAAEDADLAIACDVADEASQVAAFAQIRDAFGRLDYAFINAGVSGFSSIIDMDMAEWDRVININLRGALVSLRESARLMKRAGHGGSIITCCSLSTFKPEKMIAPYNASKAALANLTQTAARELGEFGIRVNGVAPGLTRTDIIAGTELIPGYQETVSRRTTLGRRLGESADITDAVLKLFTMQWVTGQILPVDGGLSLHTPTDPFDV